MGALMARKSSTPVNEMLSRSAENRFIFQRLGRLSWVAFSEVADLRKPVVALCELLRSEELVELGMVVDVRLQRQLEMAHLPEPREAVRPVTIAEEPTCRLDCAVLVDHLHEGARIVAEAPARLHIRHATFLERQRQGCIRVCRHGFSLFPCRCDLLAL